jgi:hypothetical protein
MRNTGRRKKEKERTAVSEARRDMCAAMEGYRDAVRALVAAPPMVRGTLRWETRGERRYAGLIRNEGGRSVGRSVRQEDVAWLERLVGALRAYRGTQRRLAKLHGEVRGASERLREALTKEYEEVRDLHREDDHGA